jgi:hypothetical protein
MSCALYSKNLAGQPWDKPGHDGKGWDGKGWDGKGWDGKGWFHPGRVGHC